MSQFDFANGQQRHQELHGHEKMGVSKTSDHIDNQLHIEADTEACWKFLSRPYMPEEDMVYLHRKGAFKLPVRNLMLALLTSYCNWVHPQLPVLNLQQFLDTVVCNDGKNVSPLLFQAVMYAGVAHLEERVLRLHGCPSRYEFQETLLTRAKLLHDFKSEPDVFTVAQATLLMSINHECSRTSTIWLAHSHLAAQKLGLESPGAYLLMGVEQSKLCIRLWWSIYIRDNTLRLEIGSPQLLQDVHYHAPRLSLDCFDLSPFSTTIQCSLSEAPFLQNLEIHRMLMQIAIERTGLVCQLSQILALRNRMSDFPRVRPDGPAYYLAQALRRWESELEPGLRFESKSSQVFEYHCGILSLLYLSTFNALLQTRFQPQSCDMRLDAIRSNVEHNNGKALDIARTLYLSGSRIPPTLGMGMVYNAVSLSITLAKWLGPSLAEPLRLDSAILCLCALVESQPRGTAVEIALCRLGSRIQGLLTESGGKVKGTKRRGRDKIAVALDIAREIDAEEQNISAGSVERGPLENRAVSPSLDTLFDWTISSDGSFPPQNK
ncbi:hypothetical protein LTR10_013139 [Elasticomyces elasticus]|uniref:Xylanolytic transcriptional activator regulatory domain-containing protein n=1 Tax=Exophiala sideris TaxID=1016849 RepID=A0ABR0JBI8_9EURO|nr:hypothetical protein LTR10_013139 [Elasticomyces elasticus]KAK5030514.1 hypothetical protein LTS07_005298 [Exophiala sideris]KAK5038568.1 hypothetical protein LTR13_004315 [Exophiala sideris]KAK5060449.1 hypothetical protein LTR69_005766 [Exophiala sideris]KAK5183361.1 hypothetical protein LTR44_004362 [Eurotiomycetes sp. CCFEE 6388]